MQSCPKIKWRVRREKVKTDLGQLPKLRRWRRTSQQWKTERKLREKEATGSKRKQQWTLPDAEESFNNLSIERVWNGLKIIYLQGSENTIQVIIGLRKKGGKPKYAVWDFFCGKRKKRTKIHQSWEVERRAFLQMKHRNTARPICLHIVDGCFLWQTELPP